MTALYKLKSPYYFWGGLFALSIYSYTFFTTGMPQTKQEWITTILGGVILLVVCYTVWCLGSVIEIYGDMIIEKNLFGYAGKKKYLLKNLTGIDQQPKYSNKLPKVAIVFTEGNVCIYEFQDGFNDAKKFIEETYPVFLARNETSGTDHE